jgi:hypothetical protein
MTATAAPGKHQMTHKSTTEKLRIILAKCIIVVRVMHFVVSDSIFARRIVGSLHRSGDF